MSQQERNPSDQEGNDSSASISYHDAERTRVHNEPRRPADRTIERIMEGLSASIRRGHGNQIAAGPNVPPLLITEADSTEADRHNRSAVRRIVRQASRRFQRVLPPGTRHLRRRMRTIEANMYEMLSQRSNSGRRSSREAWHLRPPHQQDWDYNWGWSECYYPTVRPDACETSMRYRGHPYSCEGRQDSGQLPEVNAGEPEMESFSTMHRAPPLVRRRPSPGPTLRLQAPNGMPPVFTPDGLAADTTIRNSVEDRFRVSSSQYGASGPTTNNYEYYTNIERSAHPVEHWQSFTYVENSSFGGSTSQSTNDSGYNSNSASTGMRYGNATINRPGNNYAIQRLPELWNQTRGVATTPAENSTSVQPFGQAHENYPQRRAPPVSLPPISALTQGNARTMESAGNSETAAVNDDPQTESNYVLDSGAGLVHFNQPTPIDLLTQPVNFDASRIDRLYTGPSGGEQSGRGYAGTPRALRSQHYRST